MEIIIQHGSRYGRQGVLAFTAVCRASQGFKVNIIAGEFGRKSENF